MDKFNSIKAIIFDLGDTLITHTTDEAIREETISREVHDLLSEGGYLNPEVFYLELKETMWKNWKERFSRFESEFDVEDFVHHLLYKMGVRKNDIVKFVPLIISIIYKYDLKSIVLKPTVEETLKKLQQMQYKMGIITNTSYSYDHVLEILNKVGITNFFEVVLVSSVEKICKPNPKIFQKALRLLETSATNAVFVGNYHYVDIEGAKRVGMKTILIVREGEEGLNKFQSNDTKVVSTTGDILKYIEK